MGKPIGNTAGESGAGFKVLAWEAFGLSGFGFHVSSCTEVLRDRVGDGPGEEGAGRSGVPPAAHAGLGPKERVLQQRLS